MKMSSTFRVILHLWHTRARTTSMLPEESPVKQEPMSSSPSPVGHPAFVREHNAELFIKSITRDRSPFWPKLPRNPCHATFRPFMVYFWSLVTLEFRFDGFHERLLMDVVQVVIREKARCNPCSVYKNTYAVLYEGGIRWLPIRMPNIVLEKEKRPSWSNMHKILLYLFEKWFVLRWYARKGANRTSPLQEKEDSQEHVLGHLTLTLPVKRTHNQLS